MKLKRITAVSFILVALCTIVMLLFVAAPVHGEGDGPWYFKPGGWVDYAPSGVPDFDQKQTGATNNWQNSGSGNWSFCGPVAVANSLWWFDSKQEPNPATPQGPPYPSLHNDTYYLITSYGGHPPSWDDHDPATVGGSGGPALVDDLAWYMDTDGIRDPTLPPHEGTEVHDMSYGLQWYLYGGNPAWRQPRT